MLQPLEGLATSLEALRDTPLDPVERLVRVVEAYFAFSRENPDRTRFLYAVMFGPLGQGLAAEIDRILHRLNAVMREIVDCLAEAGIIPPDAAADLVLAVRGQIVIRTMDFLYRGARSARSWRGEWWSASCSVTVSPTPGSVSGTRSE